MAKLMEKIKVNIINNGKEEFKEEIVYSVNDFPYDKLYGNKLIRKQLTKNSACYYYNLVATFDIETTTIEPNYKIKVVNKKKNKTKKDYEVNPYGFMYQWQMCVCGYVVFGRTWEEWLLFLDNVKDTLQISDKRRLVIYVHFLSFEFQFIKDFINIESVFAREKRKPIKVNTTDGLEFRCSYFLSNMSLKKFCENTENVIHYKLSGDDYDYNKLRTPQTPLTEKEKAYCYNDVMGLYECITELLKEDKITTIPITNTGYVRREFRHVMQTESLRQQFEKLMLDVEQYELCNKAFRGGNVHANRYNVNKIIDNVKSMDIQSSYPACINLDYYPIGRFMWIDIKTIKELNEYCKKYCVVMEIVIKDIIIKPETVNPYIDVAHCINKHNVVIDNGRVLKAEYIQLCITEIDYKIIKNTYNFKEQNVMIIKAMFSERGKLPIELREKMLDFYERKTKLKGVDGKEYEYLKSKNRLNSTFGMMVTDICSNEIIFSDNEWKEVEPNKEERLEKYYESRNSFLSYQWGIYVTAHARERLQRMIDIVGLDLCYCDTDSVKYTNSELYDKYFESVNDEIIQQSRNNDTCNYSEKDGKRYYLGVWDDDGFYKKFKTVGSKKYCYVDKNDKLHITVAGMSKQKGAERVGTIENFNIGKEFVDVGRTVSWYNDSDIHEITVDNCTFTTASNIGVIETTYTLGVTDQYFEVFNYPNLYLDIEKN